METDVTTTDQATGQEPQHESQDDSNVDYKALYLDEVQNSKKLRKRSQEAETKVTEFTKAQETNRVKQMKEQEQFQELSEELQKKLDSTMPYKEKWEAHETAQREKYLSKLPKADREKFANESLQVLEYMTDKLSESTTQPTQHKPGATRTVPINKPYSEMNEEERRAYYTQMANEQANSRF
tara:strand:- start:5511 stop:6056 length:546 start_codon:yes stop_codon:yes gene_type:complete